MYAAQAPAITLKQPEKEPAPLRVSGAEIQRVANKVYDLIEKRVATEKRRLGL
jgi:hypothetical protein